MADWQYQFEIVPRAGLIEQYGSVPETLAEYTSEEDAADDPDSDLANYWASSNRFSEILSSVSELLPIGDSWCADAKMFGKESGNRAELWEDCVHFRIDLRDPDMEFLQSILQIAVTVSNVASTNSARNG